MLDIEIEKLNVDRTIQGRVKRQMEKAQKEYYLNEKIKAIQKELGRGEKSEIDELKKRIETAGMTKDAHREGHGGTEAAGEYAADVGRIHRFAQLSRLAAGGAVEEEIQGNPRSAASPKKVLEADHYGLEKIKERILEFLAVRRLVKNPKGSILLLRRTSRRGQDFARHVDREGHRPQVRAHVARRRAGRSGNPRPSPHLHRRAARARSSR